MKLHSVKMTDGRKFVILIALFAGFTNCIEVQVSGEWLNGIGWQIYCNWTIPATDRLHSVRLYSTLQTHKENMFVVYRPEINGIKYTRTIPAVEFNLDVECLQTDRNSYDGRCMIAIQPLHPPNDTSIWCEVSGERPTFNDGRGFFVAKVFVPPSEAKLENLIVVEDPKRGVFNCTAQGIPAPNLVWTVGDQHNKIDADFIERYWNSSSKLWNSWSSLNFAPQNGESMQVSCTPEVRYQNSTIKGKPAVFNSGSKIKVLIPLLIALTQIIALMR